jgi:hypothetical protein
MRKVRNGFIKNLHYLCLIGIIALGLMTIVGSNGGGGGTTTPAATTGSLAITNNSLKTFSVAYLALTTATTWGSDQCTHTITPGMTWTLTDITAGNYDLRVVFTDGRTYRKSNITIVAGQTYSLTLTVTNIVGTLTIINNTSRTFSVVYLSLTTSSSWGSDQCTYTITPGMTWTLSDIPPDYYDLQVVFSTGSPYIQYNFAITGGIIYTLTLS